MSNYNDYYQLRVHKLRKVIDRLVPAVPRSVDAFMVENDMVAPYWSRVAGPLFPFTLTQTRISRPRLLYIGQHHHMTDTPASQCAPAHSIDAYGYRVRRGVRF